MFCAKSTVKLDEVLNCVRLSVWLNKFYAIARWGFCPRPQEHQNPSVSQQLPNVLFPSLVVQPDVFLSFVFRLAIQNVLYLFFQKNSNENHEKIRNECHNGNEKLMERIKQTEDHSHVRRHDAQPGSNCVSTHDFSNVFKIVYVGVHRNYQHVNDDHQVISEKKVENYTSRFSQWYIHRWWQRLTYGTWEIKFPSTKENALTCGLRFPHNIRQTNNDGPFAECTRHTKGSGEISVEYGPGTSRRRSTLSRPVTLSELSARRHDPRKAWPSSFCTDWPSRWRTWMRRGLNGTRRQDHWSSPYCCNVATPYKVHTCKNNTAPVKRDMHSRCKSPENQNFSQKFGYPQMQASTSTGKLTTMPNGHLTRKMLTRSDLVDSLGAICPSSVAQGDNWGACLPTLTKILYICDGKMTKMRAALH